MKTPIIIAVVLLFCVLLLLALISHRPSEKSVNISSITYDEMNTELPNFFSKNGLKEYSDKHAGTRVKWTGRIKDIDGNNVVYVSIDEARCSNVQFSVSHKTAKNLQKNQIITFIGIIDNISVIETFPPMPHMYVYLKDVELETENMSRDCPVPPEPPTPG